jgi:hypothetical protein
VCATAAYPEQWRGEAFQTYWLGAISEIRLCPRDAHHLTVRREVRKYGRPESHGTVDDGLESLVDVMNYIRVRHGELNDFVLVAYGEAGCPWQLRYRVRGQKTVCPCVIWEQQPVEAIVVEARRNAGLL